MNRFSIQIVGWKLPMAVCYYSKDGKIVARGKEAYEEAKKDAKGGEVKVRYSELDGNSIADREVNVKTGELNSDGIFMVGSTNGIETSVEEFERNPAHFSVDLLRYDFVDRIPLEESKKQDGVKSDVTEKYELLIEEGKNSAQIKGFEAGSQSVINFAFDAAKRGVEVKYTITSDGKDKSGIVEEESGFISEQGDFVPDADGNPINESVGKNDINFDFYLEVPKLPTSTKDKTYDEDTILYADEREDSYEGDRYPKHKEFFGNSAINKAKSLAMAEAEGQQFGGISIRIGKGKRGKDGFLRYKNGKFGIEIDKTGKFEEFEIF